MNRKVGVVLSYILMIFEVLSTLLLTPFIIRTLGDAEYGVYKLSASIVVYLLLLDLGIGNSVTRFVAKYRTEGDMIKCRRFLGITTVYYLIVAGICVISGIVLIALYPTAFAKGLSAGEIRLGQKLLAVTTLNAAVTLGIAGFKNTITAYERFDISRGVSIVSIIIRIGLTVVALKCGFGSMGIVSINLLLTVASAVVFIYVVIKKLQIRPIFSGKNSGLIKEVIAYSSFILIQMVATQINASIDSILIGMVVSSSAVIIAVYGIGQQVTQYFQTVGSAVTGVLMPGIVKMVEKGATADDLSREMVRIGRMIFMVLGLIWTGFLVNGKLFIFLWVGESKRDSFFVALFLMAAYTFILTEAVGTQILWAKNEHREQSLMKIAVVLLNLVLTVFLIKWNPLIGATIGTVISLFAGDVVVMNYIFASKLKINLFEYYKGLFSGIVPCLLLTTAAGFLFLKIGLTGWIGLAVNILVMVCVYAVLLMLFGANPYEKNLAISCLKKGLRILRIGSRKNR